jgi:spoIIIJ-associated protein
LDIPPENLNFTILSTGSKGLFGLGGRKAKIEIRPAEAELQPKFDFLEKLENSRKETPAAPPSVRFELAPAGGGPVPERAGRIDRKASDKAERPRRREQRDPKDRSSAADKGPESRKPSDRRPSGDSPAPRREAARESQENLWEDRARKPRTKPVREKAEKVRPDLQAKSKAPPARQAAPDEKEAAADDGPKIKWSAFPIPGPLTRPAPGEEISSGPPDAAMTEAANLMEEIITRLGLKAEVRAVRIGTRIVLELDSLDSYLLIGRKGASLNALELLVNRMIRQRSRREAGEDVPPEGPDPCPEPDPGRVAELLAMSATEETEELDRICSDKPEDPIDENPQIVVDSENYRARRHQGLLEKTAFMAEKVLKTGKPQMMTQLSSPERRLIHLAIESVPGLTTRSHGFGLVRNLTILPKKCRPLGARKTDSLNEETAGPGSETGCSPDEPSGAGSVPAADCGSDSGGGA